MISKEDLLYYHNIINDIKLNNEPLAYENLSALKKNIRDVFKQLTKDDNQFFSTTYARIVYSIDKFKIPNEIAKRIFYFRYLTNSLNKKSESNDIESTIKYGLDVFSELLVFFDTQKVITITELYSLDNDEPSKSIEYTAYPKNENLDFLSLIFESKGTGKKDTIFISGYNDMMGHVKIYLDKKWKVLSEQLWKSAKLNIFDLKPAKGSQDNIFFTTKETIIILEPDILLDVTDLSSCFLSSGFSPLPYFLNRLIQSSAESSMIQGNLINSIFDEIISNPEIEFEKAYDLAIKTKPLQIFALASININILKEIKRRLRENFETLKQRINEIEGDLFSVEPSFYSPLFGLQGRLDLLVEFQEDKSRKIIIELKSGKSPSTDISIKTSEGKFIKTGLWESHLAQTTCYNMLLDSVYTNRTGSSKILYVSDPVNPFRNAPNIIQKKQDIAAGRNCIIAIEKKILEGDFSYFNKIMRDNFDDLPPYVIDDLKEFKRVIREASELELEYFKHYYRYILREIYTSRVGSGDDHSNNGKSSIWRDSLDDKISSMNILPFLEFDPDFSDFDKLYFSFKLPLNVNYISSIRKGDLAILYPSSKDGDNSPVNNQIIKCSVKEISSEKVLVSIRNKLIGYDIFKNEQFWILEPDSIDSTYRYLFQSLFGFLSSEKDKRELLLGLKQGQVNDFKKLEFGNLTTIQNEIVSKAINAEDYFIIQGPPGTGKTSYILKTIVEYYYRNTDDNVLILAYTNRAVDEICSVLMKIENLNFLRLGSKESSDFNENLISFLAETMPLRDLFKIFKETRFFVSTVSSALVNPEIFSMKTFQFAIVDEASQILEPQLIGILKKVEKFILIGDEKQLPAVVLQEVERQKVFNESFNNINLINLSQSLFERLLRCCLNNGWSDSYGMLREQARMHKDIQFLANSLFYENTLEIFDSNSWQNKDGKTLLDNGLKPMDGNDKLLQKLAENRVIFIDSDVEKFPKKHAQEALRIKMILSTLEKLYGKDLKTDTIGIISPFRAQCNEIYTQISDNQKNYITIDTVERFQGSERDIIIISFAVNHPKLLIQISSELSINGVNVDRKLNVAITRAKKQIIILGSSQILRKSDIHKHLIEIISHSFCYISSNEFKVLTNEKSID